jgi:hypothetical protein
MEAEGPLPCGQKPAKGSYTEPFKSSLPHKMRFNIIISSVSSQISSLDVFRPKFRLHLFFAVHATSSDHLTLLDLIALIIFGEEHKGSQG